MINQQRDFAAHCSADNHRVVLSSVGHQHVHVSLLIGPMKIPNSSSQNKFHVVLSGSCQQLLSSDHTARRPGLVSEMAMDRIKNALRLIERTHCSDCDADCLDS